MEYKELIPNRKWNCPPDKNINVLVLCHSIQASDYVTKVKDFVWDRFSDVTIWQTKDKINNRCRLADEVKQMDAVICFVTELLMSSPNEIGDYLLPVIIENNCFLRLQRVKFLK